MVARVDVTLAPAKVETYPFGKKCAEGARACIVSRLVLPREIIVHARARTRNQNHRVVTARDARSHRSASRGFPRTYPPDRSFHPSIDRARAGRVHLESRRVPRVPWRKRSSATRAHERRIYHRVSRLHRRVASAPATRIDASVARRCRWVGNPAIDRATARASDRSRARPRRSSRSRRARRDDKNTQKNETTRPRARRSIARAHAP